jgi:hypothetical protein
MDNDTHLVEHYILTRDPHAPDILDFIIAHRLDYELHFNRTRFWVPLDSPIYTEFALRWAESAPRVDPGLDLVTGHKL